SGCPASRRSSSPPAYPLAPATATRAPMNTLPHRYAEERITMHPAGTTRQCTRDTVGWMDEHIGARIGYWRRRRGLTQAVLAGLAGVSQPFVSQVEAGQKGIERRSTLVAIAGALQVSVADLLGQPGDPTDPAKAGVARVVPAR